MTLYHIISILLVFNLLTSIVLIVINANSDSRAPSAVWDFILCVSMFICIGLEGNATPQKPETEYVECIRYFQNNKIEEPTNEDGSRLCAKYLKDQKDAK